MYISHLTAEDREFLNKTPATHLVRVPLSQQDREYWAHHGVRQVNDGKDACACEAGLYRIAKHTKQNSQSYKSRSLLNGIVF